MDFFKYNEKYGFVKLYCTQFDICYNVFIIHRLEEKRMASVAVNMAAPDFTLNDFMGNPFTLSAYKGKKNVLLVMNRGFA